MYSWSTFNGNFCLKDFFAIVRAYAWSRLIDNTLVIYPMCIISKNATALVDCIAFRIQVYGDGKQMNLDICDRRYTRRLQPWFGDAKCNSMFDTLDLCLRPNVDFVL